MLFSLEMPSLSLKNSKKNEEDPPKNERKTIYIAEAVSARLSVREDA